MNVSRQYIPITSQLLYNNELMNFTVHPATYSYEVYQSLKEVHINLWLFRGRTFGQSCYGLRLSAGWL